MPTQDFDIATEPQDMSYDSNDASFAAEEAFEPSDPTTPPEAPGTFQPAQHEPSVKYHFGNHSGRVQGFFCISAAII